MGNYKEGQIQFVLKKDTPFAVMETLLDMYSFYTEDNNNFDLRSNRILNIRKRLKTFESCENLESLILEITPSLIIPWVNNEVVDVGLEYYVAFAWVASKMGIHKITQEAVEDAYERYVDSGATIKDVKSAFKLKLFKNVVFKFRITSKYYTNEFDYLIKYLKPYVIEGHPLCIGHIEDEDGYLNKDLFLDSTEFKNKMKGRKYICEGCKKYNLNFECEHWEFCKRAYQKGTSIHTFR